MEHLNLVIELKSTIFGYTALNLINCNGVEWI